MTLYRRAQSKWKIHYKLSRINNMKEASLPSYSQWYSLAGSDIEKFGINIWEEEVKREIEVLSLFKSATLNSQMTSKLC